MDRPDKGRNMQSLKPGLYHNEGEGDGKSHSLPSGRRKSEASDGFTEAKTTVTNTTGKNQDQEESFAGSVTEESKASLTTKFPSGDCSIETGFALFCNGKEKV